MSDALLHRIQQHQYLMDLRVGLLRLHKVLLETERIMYEQHRGRVSPRELLQLVIEHEQFAWLHQISERIVYVDDLLRADKPLSPADVHSLVSDVRALLTPAVLGSAFARKYDAVLQREPDAVLAHADVTALLASMA